MKERNLRNTEVSGQSTRQELFDKLIDLRNQIIQESRSEMPSTPHRLEVVATVNGITYINDSRAVNVDLTWFALEQLDQPAIWIVGGMQDGHDYTMLREIVRDKVRAIVCLSRENSKVFKMFMADVEVVVAATTAEEAVRAATALAKPGECVILSPACPSHDLFDNYEDRGRKFVRAVLKLNSEDGPQA